MVRHIRLSLEAFAVLAVCALPAQAQPVPEFSDVGMVAAPMLAAGAYLWMRARKR